MEPEVTTEPTGGEPAKPVVEMTKIVLNGEEVEVPNIPEVIAAAQNMVHNLKSGYDKRHQEKMREVKEMGERIIKDLTDDVIYYNTHPQDEWRSYQPKTGAHIDLNEVMKNVQPANPSPEQRYAMPEQDAFRENETIREYTNKVDALEKREAARIERENKIAVESVKTAIQEAQSKFPYANIKSVGERLTHYFTVNGTHPTPDIVRQYMKEEHDFVKSAIDKVTSSGKPTPGEGITPNVSGTEPKPNKPKVPRLDDTEGMLAYITKNYSMK